MSVRLKIIGSSFELYEEPCWIKGYEDTPDGQGIIAWTYNEEEALTFPDVAVAMIYYMTQSKTQPMRPDGKPNRPITAYTVEIS